MPRPPPEARRGDPGPDGMRSRYHAGVTDPGYTDDEREFMVALDRWKRQHHQLFPTCSDCLAVLVGLGYRKVSVSE